MKGEKRKEKMGSKAFLLLCISLAVFLLIGSEVTARELAETTTQASFGTESYGHHWGHKGGHNSGHWGGHKGGHNGGHWGGHGGGGHGQHHRKPGPGGSCGNAGCCGGANSHGVCKWCCAAKGETAEP